MKIICSTKNNKTIARAKKIKKRKTKNKEQPQEKIPFEDFEKVRA